MIYIARFAKTNESVSEEFINKLLNSKKEKQKVERIYYDNNWNIDKIGDKIRISYFKDFHFVDEIFITKDMFENKTKD